MRTLLAATLLFGLTACSQAQDVKTKPVKLSVKAKMLNVGDPAPPLAKMTWLNGEEIKNFAPGKVYVLDFWAIWCGPCIQAMPHLAAIQDEYKDKGLVVVGVTTKDPNNTMEKVAEFVEKKGKKFNYAFAYCDTEDTYKSFMEAAGQDGIPCSFVVDKTGKIAYIGHPMELEDVLEKIVAGTWRGQADVDEIKQSNDELDQIMKGSRTNAADALKKLDQYATKYPARAKKEMFGVRRLVLMMQAKKLDEAKTVSDAMLKQATEKKNVNLLVNLSAIWAAEQLNPEKKHIDLAITAVETLVKIEGENDLNAVATAAEVYFAAGKKDKAIEYGEKAVKLSENPQQKAAIEEMVKKFKDGK